MTEANVNEEQERCFAYLAHNVLDLMTKGDPHNVKFILKEYDITPAYSYETFKEIQRSKGYEQNFLGLLAEIEAFRIRPLLDNKFFNTGKIAIGKFDPFEEYQNYCSTTSEVPESDFGISEMLLKMHGGLGDSSFSEILEKGHRDLSSYLTSTFEDAKDELSSLIPDGDSSLENLKRQMDEALLPLNSQVKATMKEMDENKASISEFENFTNINPNRTTKTLIVIKYSKTVNSISIKYESNFHFWF